jgi:hypothetical protein
MIFRIEVQKVDFGLLGLGAQMECLGSILILGFDASGCWAALQFSMPRQEAAQIDSHQISNTKPSLFFWRAKVLPSC